MCHGTALAAFPLPEPGELIRDDVTAWSFGSTQARVRIGLFPDIYGCNDFYKGFATYLAKKGALVALIDPFDGLAPLTEDTKEAAFQRRHNVRDSVVLDQFERFSTRHNLTGVIGFCLGGLYVFELARRGYTGDLVGFYGFPQGLPNQDPLPVPFDYLSEVVRPHTALIGDCDESIGQSNIERLQSLEVDASTMDLHVYSGSGHGFLRDLDSSNEQLAANAEQSLERCEQVMFHRASSS